MGRLSIKKVEHEVRVIFVPILDIHSLWDDKIQ